MGLGKSAGGKPGVWVGAAVGLVGVALYLGGAALTIDASRGVVVPGGESFSFTGPGPVYVSGVVEPGDDGTPPATCTLTSTAVTETVEVGTRKDRFESIGAGRYLRGPEADRVTVVCDRRVAVATGPLVSAYPLATSSVFGATALVLALLGFFYARRCAAGGKRTRQAGSGDRSKPGSLATGIGRGPVRLAGRLGIAALCLILLAGLLLLGRGDAIGLQFVALAAVLGGAALLVRRYRRTQAAKRSAATP